jgi:adenylate kinase
VLGISGVGKSHLTRAIARAMPAVLRLTASALLRKELHTTGERLRTAEGDEVRNNQSLLIEALQGERQGRWDRPVLLEAHTFIDNDRELVEVPADVMRGLDVAGIVVLEAPPEEILRRRLKDKRKRPSRTASEIKDQQAYSSAIARKYATELKVPLTFVDPADRQKAVAFIEQILDAS